MLIKERVGRKTIKLDIESHFSNSFEENYAIMEASKRQVNR